MAKRVLVLSPRLVWIVTVGLCGLCGEEHQLGSGRWPVYSSTLLALSIVKTRDINILKAPSLRQAGKGVAVQ
jgi:hypothetical protein